MTKIGTHNGLFHADDAFAIAALQLTPAFQAAEVVRTRDPKVLVGCDIRVDVGGKFNPETGDFDHHQRGGAGNRPNNVPYAAFGLVWQEYGPTVCNGREVADIVEKHLVQAIDAADCGHALATVNNQDATPYSVSAMIFSLNPTWDESASFDEMFVTAVQMAKTILIREIAQAVSVLKARDIVRHALANKAADSPLLVLDPFCPWIDVVVDEAPDVLFVLFPSSTTGWMLQATPETKVRGEFGVRMSLPESWAGKRASDLAELTGVDDAVFCHPDRFIAAAKTKEGALKLVELALAR